MLYCFVRDELDARGYAVIPRLVDDAQRAELRAAFDDDARFRSTVVMERHGYGRGVYRYFGNPLPPLVAGLRERLYAELAPVANGWAEKLGQAERYPATLGEFLERCHAAGQSRPTPLLLRYRAGDHNALHQDVYGEIAFPLQATVLLSAPGPDFEGGEFVLVEQRPRKQSLAARRPARRRGRRRLPERRSPGRRLARVFPRRFSARRLGGAPRRAAHARRHPPRRSLTRLLPPTNRAWPSSRSKARA